MKAKYEAPTMEIIKIETTTLLAGSAVLEKGFRREGEGVLELTDEDIEGNL